MTQLTVWCGLLTTLLTVCVRTQLDRQGLVCNQNDQTIEDFERWFSNGQQELNVSESEPVIEYSRQVWENTIGDLNREQVFEQLPVSVLNTNYALILQFPQQLEILHFATFEGLLRTENGTDIVFETLRRPELWADLFYLSTSSFNQSCYADPDAAIMASLLIFVQPLLQPKYQTYLADFLVGLTVQLSRDYGVENDTVAVLEPIITTISQTGDISGMLSNLLSLASEDVVAVAFEEAISSAGLETNASSWGTMMSMFFDLLQSVFDFQDAEFIEWITGKLRDVVAQLK